MKHNKKILAQIPQTYEGMHGQEIIEKHDLSHIEGMTDELKEAMLAEGILTILPFNADGEKYGAAYSIRNGQGLVLSEKGKAMLDIKDETKEEAFSENHTVAATIAEGIKKIVKKKK